jgi:hypothetical protein
VTAPRSAPSSRPVARIAAVVLVASVIALFVLAQRASPPATAPPAPQAAGSAEGDERGPPPVPPDPAILVLLDGVAPGDDLLGWKVVNFYGPHGGTDWIELQKGELFFSVGVRPKGASASIPPFTTELYEIIYGMVRPRGAAVPQQEMSAVAEEVSKRVERREKSAARPAGL